MRIAVISDTHGRQGWTIPECDVFIHAGDITAGGSRTETKRFAKAIQELLDSGSVEHVILVPGNHDRCFEKQAEETLGFFPDPRIHVLINQGVEIEGKKFWGSPYTPPFCDWHFMAEEERLREMYKDIPDAVDILITHGPPRGILDPGHDGSHVGSTELLYAIAVRNNTTAGAYNIKHHVFGHLHAAGGQEASNDPVGPTFHNVAAVDEAYFMRRGCKIIEL